VFILVSGYGVHASALALYPLSFLTLVVFTTALVFCVSALNVRYRDIQHLIGLALLVWFWMTPIVYPGGLVQDKLIDPTSPWSPHLWTVYLLNPLTPIVLGFQRALYATVRPAAIHVLPQVSVAWLIGVLSLTFVVSFLLLLYAWRLFFRLAGDFAEEL
jgi:ABC-2 type transport system permease protein